MHRLTMKDEKYTTEKKCPAFQNVLINGVGRIMMSNSFVHKIMNDY
jgi:hypothetical protein